MVDETIVKIFSTEKGITSSGLYFENPLLNSKERHIESSSAKIEDEHITLASNFLVETVGDRSRCRLVDDSEDVHSLDGSGILCGLPLGVVEIRRDRNNRFVDRCSEISFRSFLHLKKDHLGGGSPCTRSRSLIKAIISKRK